jgi:hypothetical protein
MNCRGKNLGDFRRSGNADTRLVVVPGHKELFVEQRLEGARMAKVATVDVTLCGRVFKLSPIKAQHLQGAVISSLRFVDGLEKGRVRTEDTRGLIGFLFLAARPNHPDLTISEFEGLFTQVLADHTTHNCSDKEFAVLLDLKRAHDALVALTNEHGGRRA